MLLVAGLLFAHDVIRHYNVQIVKHGHGICDRQDSQKFMEKLTCLLSYIAAAQITHVFLEILLREYCLNSIHDGVPNLFTRTDLKSIATRWAP